jgi:hypothetical protein
VLVEAYKLDALSNVEETTPDALAEYLSFQPAPTFLI